MHEIGQIIKASISGIKPYGLFLKLDEGFGFCHISNISNNFIKDLNETFYIGQFLNVKIIEITEHGKINVSIKDCQNDNIKLKPKTINKPKTESEINFKDKPIHNKTEKQTFEEMLAAFMKTSDDKFSSMNKRKQKKKK